MLLYQGNLSALSQPQLAMLEVVNLAHMPKNCLDMAQYLAHEGLWVTSGMAEGIDKQAHLGALSLQMTGTQGGTIAVLGNGIKHCYPKIMPALKPILLRQVAASLVNYCLICRAVVTIFQGAIVSSLG